MFDAGACSHYTACDLILSYIEIRSMPTISKKDLVDRIPTIAVSYIN